MVARLTYRYLPRAEQPESGRPVYEWRIFGGDREEVSVPSDLRRSIWVAYDAVVIAFEMVRIGVRNRRIDLDVHIRGQVVAVKIQWRRGNAEIAGIRGVAAGVMSALTIASLFFAFGSREPAWGIMSR